MVTIPRRNVPLVCGASYHLLGYRISQDSKIRFRLQVESYISDWLFSESRLLASYVSRHKAMAYDNPTTSSVHCTISRVWCVIGHVSHCFCTTHGDVKYSWLLLFCLDISWINDQMLKLIISVKPGSKPWNLCIVVAQLGTSGQNVTEQHPCFILHRFVFIGMGTCLIVEILK